MTENKADSTLEQKIGEVFRKFYTGGFEVDIDDNTVNVIPQNTLEDFTKELLSEMPKILESEKQLAVADALEQVKKEVKLFESNLELSYAITAEDVIDIIDSIKKGAKIK